MRTLGLSWLLLLSVPFINFGPIAGAKLTFAHFAALVTVLVLVQHRWLRLNHPTILAGAVFISGVLVVGLATVLFVNRVSALTQVINYLMMFLIFLASYSLANRSRAFAISLLERYYSIGIFLVAVSLVVFAVGIVRPGVVYMVSAVVNNANTFDLGGIAATFHRDLLPRLTGLSPEPSFWSIYIATLIAVGLALRRRPASLPMLSLFVALVCTLALTGFVAVAALFIYRVYRNRPLFLIVSILFAIAAIPLAIHVIDVNNINVDFNLSVEQRFDSLATGWRAFAGSPLFGLGWSGFVEHARINQLDYPVVFNYYLQIATDGGLFIVLFLIMFLMSVFVATGPAFRGILVVIFVAWASVPSYNLPYVWFLFGVLIATSHAPKRNGLELRRGARWAQGLEVDCLTKFKRL